MQTVVLMLAAAAAAPVHTLAAQATGGAGYDAIPVAKGGVRIRVAGEWNDWTHVYVDSAGRTIRQPLLARVNQASLGTTQLPQLAGAEAAIRTLTGSPQFALSLGALEARGDVRQSTSPITVDVGITRRVSMSLRVPYVESRDNTALLLNRIGRGATVGANPAFNKTTGASARTQNAAVLSQLARASQQLSAEISRCASPAATGCDAIRADAQGAQSLLARAATTRTAIATLYGDSLRGGSPVVPFGSTLLGESVAGGIGALRTSFEQFGVTAIAAGAAPAGASVAYGPGSLGALAQDSAFGLGYSRLGNTRRAGIGDIDLTASLLLYDTFGASQRARLTNRGRAVRSMLTLGWRFGTAAADDPTVPFDVPIGEGANALLGRSTTDIILNRALWASATVRVVKPLSDRLAVAFPFQTDSTLLSAFSIGTADRSLGTTIDVEVAPRLTLNDFFGLSSAYLVRRTGTSTLSLSNPGDGALRILSLPVSATPSSTMQRASLGITFSTLASYARNRSRLPVEVLYTHSWPVSGSGDRVPVISVDHLELRVYTGFPRR